MLERETERERVENSFGEAIPTMVSVVDDGAGVKLKDPRFG